MTTLPLIVPGHWETHEGLEKATEYATMTRKQLGYGDRSDFALANAQYLVSRDSLDLLPMQTAAKERIRWLSVQLALAQQKLTDVEGELHLLEEVCAFYANDEDAAIDGDEPYGSIPTEVGLKARSARKRFRDREAAELSPCDSPPDPASKP